MSLPGETFPFPEHLQELPAQGRIGKPHSQHGHSAAQEAQNCRAQHKSGFEIWVTSGSVITPSRDGAFRPEAALSAARHHPAIGSVLSRDTEVTVRTQHNEV